MEASSGIKQAGMIGRNKNLCLIKIYVKMKMWLELISFCHENKSHGSSEYETGMESNFIKFH